MSPIRTMRGLETCWKQTKAEPGNYVFIASNHTRNERLTTFYAASQRKYDIYKRKKHSGQTDRDSHTHTNQTAADLRLQHAEERKKNQTPRGVPLFRKITPLLLENEGCWPPRLPQPLDKTWRAVFTCTNSPVILKEQAGACAYPGRFS